MFQQITKLYLIFDVDDSKPEVGFVVMCYAEKV